MKDKKMMLFSKIFDVKKYSNTYLFQQQIFNQLMASDFTGLKNCSKGEVRFVLRTARCTNVATFDFGPVTPESTGRFIKDYRSRNIIIKKYNYEEAGK